MSISNPGWTALIFAGWIAALGPGEIEGSLDPAATPLEMTETRILERNWIAFDGETTRRRPECNFMGVEWFLGDRKGAFVPTDVEIQPPKLRPETGVIEITDWRVYVGNTHIGKTFADVLHECRTLGTSTPWLVRTPWWK